MLTYNEPEKDDADETAPAKLSPEELFALLDEDDQAAVCSFIALLRGFPPISQKAHQN